MIFIVSSFMMSLYSSTRMKRNCPEDDLIPAKIDQVQEVFLLENLSNNTHDYTVNPTSSQSTQSFAKLGKFDFLCEHEKIEFLTNLDRSNFLEFTSEELEKYFQELPNKDNTFLFQNTENSSVDSKNSMPEVPNVTQTTNINLVNNEKNILFTDKKYLLSEDENVRASATVDEISKKTFETDKNDENLKSQIVSCHINNEFVSNDESMNNYSEKIHVEQFKTPNTVLNIPTIFIEEALLPQINVLVNSDFIIFEEFTLKSFIENFISKNIQQSYTSTHLRNIKSIEKFYDIFDKFKIDHAAYINFFSKSEFKDILQELLNIVSSFEKNLKFNEFNCQRFLFKFDKKIFKSFISIQFCWDLEILPDNQKYLFFYSELMKLYKYLDVIPEILTLGGLNPRKSFQIIIMIMHIINLFAENIDNVKNYRVFILFLISKAFTCYYGGTFDIFRIRGYRFRCSKSFHDLTFFLWELNCTKRQNIKRRKKIISYKYEFSDRIFLKTILLIYLYQHTIFFKFNDVDADSVKSFEEFIVKVVVSNDCIGCLFNEYLSNVNYKK